jgi:carboxymethylenebutenolidase
LGSKIKAAVPFYGIPSTEYFPVSTIDAPLLLHFGTKDSLTGFSDYTAVQQLIGSLMQHDKKFTLESYPAAEHAFMNEDRPEVFHPASAKAAFQTTVSFLKKQLQ